MSSSIAQSLAVLRLNRAHNVAVYACVGAVACAGAYVIFGGDRLFKTRGQCPGLINSGNCCYVNSILQSLATLPEVHEWLHNNMKSGGGNLIRAVHNLLSELVQENTLVHSAGDVLLALRAHRWKINAQQQDTHEFYLVLMSTLDEELVTCPSLEDIIKESSNCKQVWTRSGPTPVPFRLNLSSPMRGMMNSELYCMQCHHTMPLKYEFFDCISVTIPEYVCTLENSMLEFVKSEVVQDVTCAQCTKEAGKPTKQTHLKRIQIKRAPAVLCIHIQRTVWQMDGSVAKDDRHLAFPSQLNASVMLKGSTTSVVDKGSGWYRLNAVVEHHGGPNSGHYVTYRRTKGNSGRWVCTSDSVVHATSLSDVLEARAYMLFYSRNKGAKS